jgi:hypothetical protein
MNIKDSGESSDFEPFTCSCGVGGCAGIYDGINSKHGKNIVKWKVLDKKTRKLLGKKYFSFEKIQCENEISQVMEFISENKDLIIYDGMNEDGYPLSDVIANFPIAENL